MNTKTAHKIVHLCTDYCAVLLPIYIAWRRLFDKNQFVAELLKIGAEIIDYE
jgi:hypothetical protein